MHKTDHNNSPLLLELFFSRSKIVIYQPGKQLKFRNAKNNYEMSLKREEKSLSERRKAIDEVGLLEKYISFLTSDRSGSL